MESEHVICVPFFFCPCAICCVLHISYAFHCITPLGCTWIYKSYKKICNENEPYFFLIFLYLHNNKASNSIDFNFNIDSSFENYLVSTIACNSIIYGSITAHYMHFPSIIIGIMELLLLWSSPKLCDVFFSCSKCTENHQEFQSKFIINEFRCCSWNKNW